MQNQIGIIAELLESDDEYIARVTAEWGRHVCEDRGGVPVLHNDLVVSCDYPNGRGNASTIIQPPTGPSAYHAPSGSWSAAYTIFFVFMVSAMLWTVIKLLVIASKKRQRRREAMAYRVPIQIEDFGASENDIVADLINSRVHVLSEENQV